MKCDLCHAEIVEIKFRCSPEKFARAVKNGLTPNMQELNLSREQYKKDFGVEFDDRGIPWIMSAWKKMAMVSETDWALCEKCKARVETKL